MASCAKNQDRDAAKSSSRREQEAKYEDVPLPVGYVSKRFEEDADKSSYFFSYSGGLKVDQAIFYYRQNMERLGWDIKDFSGGGEGLLTCSKKSRTCALSIRARSQGSLVNVFVRDNQSVPVHVVSDDINAKEICLT